MQWDRPGRGGFIQFVVLEQFASEPASRIDEHVPQTEPFKLGNAPREHRLTANTVSVRVVPLDQQDFQPRPSQHGCHRPAGDACSDDRNINLTHR